MKTKVNKTEQNSTSDLAAYIKESSMIDQSISINWEFQYKIGEF